MPAAPRVHNKFLHTRPHTRHTTKLPRPTQTSARTAKLSPAHDEIGAHSPGPAPHSAKKATHRRPLPTRLTDFVTPV